MYPGLWLHLSTDLWHTTVGYIGGQDLSISLRGKTLGVGLRRRTRLRVVWDLEVLGHQSNCTGRTSVPVSYSVTVVGTTGTVVPVTRKCSRGSFPKGWTSTVDPDFTHEGSTAKYWQRWLSLGREETSSQCRVFEHGVLVSTTVLVDLQVLNRVDFDDCNHRHMRLRPRVPIRASRTVTVETRDSWLGRLQGQVVLMVSEVIFNTGFGDSYSVCDKYDKYRFI